MSSINYKATDVLTDSQFMLLTIICLALIAVYIFVRYKLPSNKNHLLNDNGTKVKQVNTFYLTKNSQISEIDLNGQRIYIYESERGVCQLMNVPNIKEEE